MTDRDADFQHLTRAVDLAEKALETGTAPSGSVLVCRDGQVLFAAHTQVGVGQQT